MFLLLILFFKASKAPTFSFVKPSWMTLYALMIKNLTKMWRNMTALLFVFLLPAVEVFFFCVAIGKDPSHLPLGIGIYKIIQSLGPTLLSKILNFIEERSLSKDNKLVFFWI